MIALRNENEIASIASAHSGLAMNGTMRIDAIMNTFANIRFREANAMWTQQTSPRVLRMTFEEGRWATAMQPVVERCTLIMSTVVSRARFATNRRLVIDLVLSPPILPMLAKRVEEIPAEGSWIFEPKWDGFRTLIFRDGDEIVLQSRDGKSLNRYFPEMIEPLRKQLPSRCVLDGEIVVVTKDGLDFDALQQRIHPAASRVKLLAAQTPASAVFFDLLCEGNLDLTRKPFADRRGRLEKMLRTAEPPLHLTPSTADRATAVDWFLRFEGAGLDGVMAKGMDSPYQPDKRVMLKVKHERDCDCVVAGFRWHKSGEDAVGSLLLGLYDDRKLLQHVGVCASFTMPKRKELVELLAPYRHKALRDHPWASWAEQGSSGRMPGAQSRWSQGKDLAWEPLRPELVVEVAYDHMQRDRFRHTAQFRRWRSDKAPPECTYAQLEVVPPQELNKIFVRGR